MAPSSEELQVLKVELQKWLDRSKLASDALWYTPDEYYLEHDHERLNHALLFLISNKAVGVVLNSDPIPGSSRPRPELLAIKVELEDLLHRQGFGYDFDGTALYFFRCL